MMAPDAGDERAVGEQRGPLEIATFTAPGFGENAYLVSCRDTGATIAIDPGGGADEMAAALERAGRTLDAVLLTHAHLDHVEGVAALVRRTGAPVYLHPEDQPLYAAAPDQAAMFGMTVDPPPPVDHSFSDGQEYRFGDRVLRVTHVPGHSPGHVMLQADDAGAVFIGDVVFMGSIGRTDLPGGDYSRLMQSIRTRVLTLPDETVLYPGHGPRTSVGRERATNPFLTPQFGGGLA